MKTISGWRDLEPYGIIPLTLEACGLSYRLLLDVTEQGRKILGHCLGIPNMTLGEAWNGGTKEAPHVGSVMLAQVMLVPVAVFALLEGGCREAYLLGNDVVGIEPGDPADTVETLKRVYRADYARRFSYGGTAGDRNTHQMTGRVE
ncbi:hypothetical protein EP7_004353 [Isosphaeraceae bacterium EP7]